MLSPGYSISPQDLWNAIATQMAPQIIDVRRRDAYEQSPHLLPGAFWMPAKPSNGKATSIRLARSSLPARPAMK